MKRTLFWIGFASVAMNLMMLAPIIFMLQVLDRVLTSRSTETLTMLIIGVCIALVLLVFFDYLRQRLQNVAGMIVAERVSPQVASALLDQFSRHPGAASPENLRDVQRVRAVVAGPALLALFDAPWLIVFVIVIALFHPLLGIVAACAALLMIGLACVAQWSAARRSGTLREKAIRTSSTLESSLANAEVVQAMGMGKGLINRWRDESFELARAQNAAGIPGAGLAALARMTRQMIQVVMLGIGAWLVIQGEASAGVMIAGTILLGRALAPVEHLVSNWRKLVDGRQAWRRIRDLLAAAESRPAPMSLPAPSGALSMRGVFYRSQDGRPILSNVSWSIDAGDSMAIIGASAGGKSTLARVMIGIWRCSIGEVRLDGVSMDHWPRETLGPHIGYMPQDVELFGGTVAENIARLGQMKPQAVVRAAQRAQVHELILALPNGYDTVIGAQGAMLSPGQRQRIALARALYGDPCLVVLDEPNANLDGEGEIALAVALRGLKSSGVTTIVITHRPALIAHVDKLLVIDSGRVKHFGPAKQVIATMQKPAPKANVVPLRAKG